MTSSENTCAAAAHRSATAALESIIEHATTAALKGIGEKSDDESKRVWDGTLDDLEGFFHHNTELWDLELEQRILATEDTRVEDFQPPLPFRKIGEFSLHQTVTVKLLVAQLNSPLEGGILIQRPGLERMREALASACFVNKLKKGLVVIVTCEHLVPVWREEIRKLLVKRASVYFNVTTDTKGPNHWNHEDGIVILSYQEVLADWQPPIADDNFDKERKSFRKLQPIEGSILILDEAHIIGPLRKELDVAITELRCRHFQKCLMLTDAFNDGRTRHDILDLLPLLSFHPFEFFANLHEAFISHQADYVKFVNIVLIVGDQDMYQRLNGLQDHHVLEQVAYTYAAGSMVKGQMACHLKYIKAWLELCHPGLGEFAKYELSAILRAHGSSPVAERSFNERDEEAVKTELKGSKFDSIVTRWGRIVLELLLGHLSNFPATSVLLIDEWVSVLYLLEHMLSSLRKEPNDPSILTIRRISGNLSKDDLRVALEEFRKAREPKILIMSSATVLLRDIDLSFVNAVVRSGPWANESQKVESIGDHCNIGTDPERRAFVTQVDTAQETDMWQLLKKTRERHAGTIASSGAKNS